MLGWLVLLFRKPTPPTPTPAEVTFIVPALTRSFTVPAITRVFIVPNPGG